ncbi:DUF3348 family protein [Pandoraea pulmonicola]|nr:DUF3348 family protein [Pandoraea pulmonicola]SUA91304.1 Uncharacterised protein [Pandoraea pulmonicola]
MSDSSQQPPRDPTPDPIGPADTIASPPHAEASQAARDDLFVRYERACGEVQLAGRRLQRQMQEYEALLADIRQLEASRTPEAHEKLARLQALMESAAFQREEREIARMATALASTVERLKADAPPPPPPETASWSSPMPSNRPAGRSLATRSPRA